MNKLKRRLLRRIALQGPITVAEYMTACLTDPQHGYYMHKDPLGRAGDFVTAPEVSQMFGELLGLWCVDAWDRILGRPETFNLVELGPGRGTLMADALRAARVSLDFMKAAKIHLVEFSPALRDKQRSALTNYAMEWHQHFEGVPDGPFILLANEFFDALPIRQLVRTERGFVERMIGADESGENLRFGLAPGPSPLAAMLPPELAGAPIGSVAELSPASISLIQSIADRVARAPGAALIVDYGSTETGPGDSLQAVKQHRKADPLTEPGEADLTAHVDFATLARAARDRGAAVSGPATQQAFLANLGIAERANRLASAADPRQATEIKASLGRLIDSAEMGTLFKALALGPSGKAAPAGF